ncbi:MAG: hypothetical protein HY805_03965 [Nitrospirae bacterium]|nr:hypothetical protein [Nitrospirota bacterium]
MMKKALILGFILTLAISQPVFAQEEEVYKFPELKPEYSFKFGYRLTNIKGSHKAGKFEYLRNSITLGGEYIAFPFPHRIYLEVDVLNKKDYFGDIRYAYKDIVRSRWLRRTLYHNLDNITLVDLNTGTASPGITRNDADINYGVSVGIDTVFLRLKTPDFPFHFYIDSRFIHKKGSTQQIFLGGSGYFSRIIRVSEKRTVDWTTQDVTVGANSHLGPLEVDLSHSEKSFEVDGGRLMEYFYTPGTSGRAEGTYPHHLIPDTEGSTTTLKLHTSHTGRLFAGTTLSWADRENNTSGAKADYFVGAGTVTWMPLTRLTVFLKYRHRESEMNNPDTLPANYLGYPGYTVALTGIRDSISTKTDNLSWIIRYRVIPKVTLNLRYSYDQYERGKGQLQKWDPSAKEDTMQKNTINLTADAKPSKELKLKVAYEHQETDSPAHNTHPNRADKGSVSVTWNPDKRINAFFNHEITTEKRNDIHYVGPYNDQLDRNAIYKDSTQNYTINLTYVPTKRLDLQGGVNITNSRADFSPNLHAALYADDTTKAYTYDEASIASFSKLKIRETDYTLSGGYDLRHGWRAELSYRYSKFDDLIENPNNPEFKDSIAQLILLTFSKSWE